MPRLRPGYHHALPDRGRLREASEPAADERPQRRTSDGFVRQAFAKAADYIIYSVYIYIYIYTYIYSV